MRRRPVLGGLAAAVIIATSARCGGSSSEPVGTVLLSLDPPSASIRVGATLQFTPKLTVGGKTSNEAVIFSTDNAAVVTVSAQGLVRALSVGSASISARTSTGASTSAVVTVGPGLPFAVTRSAGDNQSAAPATRVAVSPAVSVRDSAGNLLSGVVVTFAVALGGGSITGATAVTNVSGAANLGAWMLGATPGTNTVTATVSELAPVVFTATAAAAVAQPATRLGIVTQPSGGTTGAVLSSQPVVHVRDANGGTVLGATDTVTASLNGAGGTLGGTATVGAVNGVATFTNLVVNGVGTFTVTFTSGPLVSVTSAPITIAAGASQASQLVIAIQPGGAQTGRELSSQPVVQVRGTDGSVVGTSAAAVSATLNGAGGTLSGATTVTAVNGVATFANLVVTGSGNYSLTFSSSALTAATSGAFTITVPPASQATIGFNVGASATANGANGTNLAIPILADMSNAQGQVLASLSFNFTWDPAKLDFVSTANGTFGASGNFFVNTANQSAGSISVSMFDNNGFSAGAPTIFTVALKPKASAISTVVSSVITAAGNDLGVPIPNSKFIVRNLAVTTP